MQESELVVANTFRDTVSTVTKEGKRKWIFATKPKGKFYTLRSILAAVYLVVFFSLPLIKIHGKPFMLFNVAKGEFILFGNIFWPQDFIVFAIGMLAFIVFIIIFTIIFGRLFCGWVCPQTIFMEFIFRKIEWWIEGSPSQQMQLEKEGWTGKKIFKKTTKHILFFLLSFIIAHTFLSYIIGFDEVKKIVTHSVFDNIGLFFGLMFFTALFYVVYAFVRDITCTTICPYGRLQGVMVDKNTMQISYDYRRGEPRGFLKKNQKQEVKGDCIDCKKCVHVCPTGIDIRNGVQLDCIGCTACIDACNEVMMKINRDTGLIRYASENEIAKAVPFRFTKRIKAYMSVLAVLVVLMAYLIFSSKHVEMIVSRAGGSMYQQHDGLITNFYNGKIFNKTNKELNFEIKVENMSGHVTLIGNKHHQAKKENITDIVFMVDIPENEIKKRSNKIVLGVYADNKKIQTITSKFLGPFNF